MVSLFLYPLTLDTPYSEYTEDPSNSLVALAEDIGLKIFLLMQQYGFLVAFVLAMCSFFLRHLAKLRKNTLYQSFFLRFSIGMCVAAVVFAFLPYLSLHFMEKSDVPVEESTSWVVPIIDFLQSYSIITTIIVVLISFVNYCLANVRKNKRVKTLYVSLALGMIVICVLFQILPELVLQQTQY